MRLVILTLVAACSFEHGNPVGGAADVDAAASVDTGPVVVADATVTPPLDAPPCADDDSDGVCNADDDWPCGVKPTQPVATIAFDDNNGATRTTITNVNLDGTGALAVASSQENLTLGFAYEIKDKACSSACVDQIEIGWVPGARAGCVFDAQVSKQNGADGTISVMIRAPQAKQVYDLRVNLGQNFSCTANGANNWWNGTPAATKTVAKLCVH